MRVEELHLLNDRYQAFNDLIPEDPDFEYGFHFSAKDNICAMGFQARAGSRILDGYRPPFDAAAVDEMRECGGLLLGKTNQDEFGFGTFSVNSGYGVPRNPYDLDRSCGGSSGGSACAAAILEGHVALGESTGGSIACPASFCGVIGLTPTYGRVSRYGLIDYGNSLDKIGLLSRDPTMVGMMLPVISGADERDPTSCAQPGLTLDGEVERLAVPTELIGDLSGDVAESFRRTLDVLESKGLEVDEVSMPMLKLALPAYYVLATCEASTNLARYCGMRYGVRNTDYDAHFDEYFSKTRSSELGAEAKRRIVLGTYTRMVGFRDRYYMRALSVRQLVIDEYRRVFDGHDAVLTPTMPFIAPRFDEIAALSPLDQYKADAITVPPNLAGLPHISMPSDYVDGMPVGIMLTAPHWDEGRLLSAMDMWFESFEPEWPEVRP